MPLDFPDPPRGPKRPKGPKQPKKSSGGGGGKRTVGMAIFLFFGVPAIVVTTLIVLAGYVIHGQPA